MKSTDHPYTLQPYTGRNSRHTCPACGKSNQFSRYMATETGEIVAPNVGRCNRIDKCGYHYTPKQYFTDNNLQSRDSPPFSKGRRPQDRGVLEPNYIDSEPFKSSLKNYENNNLITYLHTLFNTEQVNLLTNLYNIGTSSRWKGGTTIFWQIDTKGTIRTGKLIKYNPTTGKRIKNLTNWVHSVLKIENFNLKQCLFGEQLLTQFPDKTVGIVESEKTAIIAAVFLPGLIWLATGGAENLNKEIVKPLRGRNVILFPDASKDGRIYRKWKEKAKQFGFEISDYLEQYTTEEQKANGLDIADFLKHENKPKPINKSTAPSLPLGEMPAGQRGSQPLPITIGTQPRTNEHNDSTSQIPYTTPSPVALIDSKIKNPPKFEGKELLIKNRIFTTSNGDKIELTGIRDFGYCGDWQSHKNQNGYCRACLLNCLHTLKINGKRQQREYTQLEILLMQ